MEKCCIYKLREGKQLNNVQEIFSKYVYAEDFARNHLSNDGIYIIYRYIDIETFCYNGVILGAEILPCNVFEEYFELYLKYDQIRDKLNEINPM